VVLVRCQVSADLAESHAIWRMGSVQNALWAFEPGMLSRPVCLRRHDGGLADARDGREPMAIKSCVATIG